MKRTLICPRKYVQGPNLLAEIGELLKPLGRKPLILWDGCLKEIVGPSVRESLRQSGLVFVEADFQGEATLEERKRVGTIAREQECDIAVGIGGGKALDVAKGAAVDCGLKMVTCPTIASNDSPTSAASVWYDENHNFLYFECWPCNPDLVIVDSRVISRAPVRSFVAGMGDALATWVETEAARQTRAKNLSGGVPTLAATYLGQLCFDTLLEYGVDAKRDVEHQALTPAVEKVIEANTLLSGLGFESGGLATAHALGNELSNIPECQKIGLMHGEKVAFGVITQLCLDDDVEVEYRDEIVDFMIEVGLPVTFAELNLPGVLRERLVKIAEVCAAEGSLCHNHPFDITVAGLVDAMISADALGRAKKARLAD